MAGAQIGTDGKVRIPSILWSLLDGITQMAAFILAVIMLRVQRLMKELPISAHLGPAASVSPGS